MEGGKTTDVDGSKHLLSKEDPRDVEVMFEDQGRGYR
jgi:hypothetical protein